MSTRTKVVAILAGCVLAAGAATAALTTSGDSPRATSPEIHVVKSPTCGCCEAWVEHLREHGFHVTVEHATDLMETKRRWGVPRDLSSCHTARVAGYTIEGHVPAEDVLRLLAEEPEVAGLAVPGMPAGSPGMEFAGYEPYSVVAFDGAGGRTVFATH